MVEPWSIELQTFALRTRNCGSVFGVFHEGEILLYHQAEAIEIT
jgi:hypothetical protein